MIKLDTANPKGHLAPKHILNKIEGLKNDFITTAQENEKLIIIVTPLQVVELQEEIGLFSSSFNNLQQMLLGTIKECIVLGITIRMIKETVEKVVKLRED